MRRRWLLSGEAVLAGLLSTVLFGCGGGQNFNRIWGRDNGGDTLLLLARTAYDKGDFAKAEDLAQEVLDNNRDNESAAILLGYINLSRGGVDPYRLARKLVCVASPNQSGCNSQDTSETASTLTLEELDHAIETLAMAAQDAPPSEKSDSENSNDASTTLKKLGTILDISNEEMKTQLTRGELCATLQADGKQCASDLFKTPDTEIYVPHSVSEDWRGTVQVLKYMNQAMVSICRFVDDDIMQISSATLDARYANYQCSDKPTGRRRDAAKAHFLFALTHLTEAIVYQRALLYDSNGGSGSNLQTAADTLDNQNFVGADGIKDFVNKVGDLKSAAEYVFNTADSNSMVAATLIDLIAVKNSFAKLSGLPPAMTRQITKTLDKINEIAQRLGQGGSSDIGTSTRALRGQMIEKFSKVIGKKIDNVIAGVISSNEALGSDPELAKKLTQKSIDEIPDSAFGEGEAGKAEKQKLKESLTNMCGAYDSLANDMDPATKNPPQACAS